MIRTVLEFIKKELEGYMVEREQDPGNYSTGTVVDLTSIVAPDGTIKINATTHISVMLIGVEEEAREGKRPYYLPTDDKQFLRLNPPVELNLYILFVAHSDHYETALRDISDVISFFQANPVFDEQKFPTLNASVVQPDKKPWQLIERLTFKLYSLSFEQQNNLWAMLGAKYMPNVVYKMNLLTIFETKSKEKMPGIKELNLTEN